MKVTRWKAEINYIWLLLPVESGYSFSLSTFKIQTEKNWKILSIFKADISVKHCVTTTEEGYCEWWWKLRTRAQCSMSSAVLCPCPPHWNAQLWNTCTKCVHTLVAHGTESKTIQQNTSCSSALPPTFRRIPVKKDKGIDSVVKLWEAKRKISEMSVSILSCFE